MFKCKKKKDAGELRIIVLSLLLSSNQSNNKLIGEKTGKNLIITDRLPIFLLESGVEGHDHTI